MSSRTRRSAAPATSPRPVRRPDNLVPESVDTPPDFGRSTGKPGMYEGLGIQDETAEFGDLGVRKRSKDPDEVILHQTASATGDATRSGYANRIKNNEHTGAHYLIDEEGQTSLTVPTDEMVYHAKGHNSNAIGIETVGAPNKVNPRGDLHAQIEALDLTPDLKERLLAMSASALKNTLRDNGNLIYGDITGPQKRANWNLLRAIAKEHGIDMTADVKSHEHVQAKTIGEGENIEEFVDAMKTWPDKIAQLEAMVRDATAQDGQLEAMRVELERQKAIFAAVKIDGTPQEKNAVDGEALLGDGGPATEREALRKAFWDAFYPNMERLDGWLR